MICLDGIVWLPFLKRKFHEWECPHQTTEKPARKEYLGDKVNKEKAQKIPQKTKYADKQTKTRKGTETDIHYSIYYLRLSVDPNSSYVVH